MEGFDVDLSKTLSQLKDKLMDPNTFKPQQQQQPGSWSIWDKQVPGPPPRTGVLPIGPQAELPQQQMAAPPRMEAPPSVQLRPEQMLSTNRADERTAQSVYYAIDQAQKQSNRTQAAGFYVQAIQWANNARDPALQAMSKVEYGLANMSWGFSQEGFKWILEAGSNNPTLYDPRMNQSFVKRLAQAGMPQAAVDLLIRNGQQDPTWYAKDTDATKKLDQAMTGPVSVAPIDAQQRPGGDPLAPPQSRPEQALNPNLDGPGQATPWMKEQVNNALRSAIQEKDRRNAFGFFKQAVDMSDRTRDPALQSLSRVELGLAIISWGMPETGFKWLLDAGAKNPGLYDSARNGAFLNRLAQGALPKSAIDLYVANGQRDPNWHLRDAEAAKKLEAAMKPQQQANPVPKPNNQIWPQPEQAQPGPFQPRLRPSPFGG